MACKLPHHTQCSAISTCHNFQANMSCNVTLITLASLFIKSYLNVIIVLS